MRSRRWSNVRYVSWDELHRDVAGFAAQLPDADGLVGIPRSGTMVANLLAIQSHKPTADVETFLRTGSFWATGRRLPDPGKARYVLVVDDSVNTAATFRDWMPRLRKRWPRVKFEPAALYASPDTAPRMKHYWRVVPQPRAFAWNWTGKKSVSRWMFDMDGVLCVDPPVPEDDATAYLEYISDATPLHLPSRPIGWVVTSRLEKHRGVTERWLERHGVRTLNGVVMRPEKTYQARRKAGRYGRRKGLAYAESNAVLFVESSAKQAAEIHATSGKPVLCVDADRLING